MRECDRFWRLLIPAQIALLLGVSTAVAQPVVTPNFRDQSPAAAALPPLPDRARVRFLTSVDYPPFNFLDARGRLAGLNVELSRAICEELDILDVCQIEAMPFEELLPALLRGDGDAVIAGLAVTAEARSDLVFTGSYFRYPARLIARTDNTLDAALGSGMQGQAVGVVEGTAHQAMLLSFFPEARATPFADRQAMLDAVRDGSVEAAFGDGVGLAFWLGSENAAGCCTFAGGPYLSDVFLGEGLSIALRASDSALAQAFDGALARIVAERRFSEIMLRYFPISAF